MLIIIMASTSRNHAHPDEHVHMAATAYYQDHWLPPVLDDPAISNTFSIYGVSRLNNGEVYYLFAGKFHKFMQTFNVPNYLSLRLFNVCLFGLILLYAIRNRYARMAALPFLVSSQIWYIFSYCASDAFALFFAFLAACELIDPDSLLYRYLKGENLWAKVIGGLGLGVLLGIVFLLKKNYLPFIVFFYLALAVKIFLTEEFFWDRKKVILRVLFMTFIGLSVFGLRVGADYWVNGLDRAEKLDRMQEELSDYLHKPSTELDKKHVTLYRKARGVTLERVIYIDRWFEQSFRSSFGVFGYFTISGSYLFYDLVRCTGVALLVIFFASIFRGGGLIGSGLAIAGLGLSAGLIGVSLYSSWTQDFQPQGRYLFSLLPIFGILYGFNHAVISQRLLNLALIPMFALAMYSFIFEALMRIPRMVFS